MFINVIKLGNSLKIYMNLFINLPFKYPALFTFNKYVLILANTNTLVFL